MAVFPVFSDRFICNIRECDRNMPEKVKYNKRLYVAGNA